MNEDHLLTASPDGGIEYSVHVREQIQHWSAENDPAKSESYMQVNTCQI